MNSPENRYDSDGWLCQYASRLRSRSGRRRNGESVGRRAAEHEVIAAAGAGVPAVEHELLGDEPRLARGFVQVLGALDELVPARRRMDVHFDHARIGRDAEAVRAARSRGGS